MTWTNSFWRSSSKGPIALDLCQRICCAAGHDLPQRLTSGMAWFWQHARKQLDQLGISGRIMSRDREKIEAALAQRVPPMTQELEAVCCLKPKENR